jgi:hypothetical protein
VTDRCRVNLPDAVAIPHCGKTSEAAT